MCIVLHHKVQGPVLSQQQEVNPGGHPWATGQSCLTLNLVSFAWFIIGFSVSIPSVSDFIQSLGLFFLDLLLPQPNAHGMEGV